jgi:hypothetical protein
VGQNPSGSGRCRWAGVLSAGGRVCSAHFSRFHCAGVMMAEASIWKRSALYLYPRTSPTNDAANSRIS